MQFDMYLESTKVTPLNARVSYMGTTFISALISLERLESNNQKKGIANLF